MLGIDIEKITVKDDVGGVGGHGVPYFEYQTCLRLISPTGIKVLEGTLNVFLRGDDAPLNPQGNLIVNNIHQLYESRQPEWTPESIVDAILGRKPQKDLTKAPLTLLDRIKQLDNLIVMNDEAHHVHDEELQWHKTLISIHDALPRGLILWLDFSATPKTQTGTYYPWIIVDYPLAQAVEDRIVKTPLIVHRIDKKDPENINRDNVIQKYGDWLTAALERWKEHFEVYSKVGKKPVLFIMAEKNEYADRIAEAIRKQKAKLGLANPEEEVLVIHTDSSGEIRKVDLERLRRAARDIDEPHSPVKIIVSVMMLREGWDVKSVTTVLGLRPFTSKAEILPEQAVGRGLRLMQGISTDHTQTLEVMGTQAFEDFVRELEKEGVGINTVKTNPPLPVTIAPERSRFIYDIEIPGTELRYTRNYKRITDIDPLNLPSLYTSDKLEEERKIFLRMEFPMTETEVHQADIEVSLLLTGREIISHITGEIMKRARLTANFHELYPLIEKYILKRCFEVEISEVENEKLRKHLSDIAIQEAIIDLLSREIGKATAESKETVLVSSPLKLSKVEPFTWRRKRLRCDKTLFNFVAVYNDFEAEFAEFLARCGDIARFAALADRFKIDYLSSRGAIRFYYPDFIAVQKKDKKEVFWIIETKGREWEDTDRKDAAIKKWCEDVSAQTKKEWKYLKVLQSQFDPISKRVNSFKNMLSGFQKEPLATKTLFEQVY
jgi:type III restriction enzyme